MRSFLHNAVTDGTSLRYTGSIHGRKVRDYFPAVEEACNRFTRGEAVTCSNWNSHGMPPVTVQPASRHSAPAEERKPQHSGTRVPPPSGAKFNRLMHMRDGDIEHTGDAVYIAMMATTQPLAVDYTVTEA